MVLNKIEPILDKLHGLRSSLNVAFPEQFPRVICVVSTRRGEGTTTVAMGLAVSLARQKKRVALIDLNFREQGISALFGAPPRAGISDVLAGNAVWKDVARDFAGVQAAPSGTSPVTDPLDLLESQDMRAFLQTLKNDYDAVIIDTPCLSEYRDSVIISRLSDYVLYVIGSGMAPREKVKESVRLLGDVRLGIVLNREKD
jgi:capsular exopolysaccharide synthesis family protein